VASRAEIVLGHVRLTHPFPSLLDGLVAGAAALAAGGGPSVAVRLGISMVLLQASVGALNDVIDAPSDAGRKPGKPIPAGLVRPGVAKGIAAAAAVGGVALAVPSGFATGGLALVLLALGVAYDLWYKGTAWSWVPFALAIPLFPTYGWLGAAGTLPAIWVVLLPTAVLAGTALALANATVDVERDRAAGLESVATRLGRERARSLNVALLGVVWALATATLWGVGELLPWGLAALAGGVAAVAGWSALGSADPRARERGWEAQAVGVALLAAGWLAAMVGAGLTATGG
jgi:4-hydroxybenzoate polyprenyltransferase